MPNDNGSADPADPALALETRTGLPDALRVLLERYPRAAWEGDPGFGGLVRFWLERHLMFRQVQDRLISETEAFLDDATEPVAFAGRLYGLASAQVDGLLGHHQIEDHHYFPRLQAVERRLERGFAILDADHHALDGHIRALAEDTNAVLASVAEGRPAGDDAGRLHGRLLRFGGFLDRHLTDEEDLVVPVVLANPEAGIG
jgi:hypothetical protein